MANSIFDFAMGTAQGRMDPSDFAPAHGTYVFCLGAELGTVPPSKLAIHDYVEVHQTGDLTAYAFLHATARLVPPTTPPPAGCYWWFSLLVDDVEVAGHRVPDDRVRYLTDLGADVAELFGDHKLAFRLELLGAGGPYEVVLPAVYVDSVTFDASPFYPLSLPDCDVWLRADVGVTTTTGTARWLDLSTTATNLSQSTPANKPGQVGSAVEFDKAAATSLYNDNNYDQILGAYTVGIAVQFDDQPSADIETAFQDSDNGGAGSWFGCRNQDRCQDHYGVARVYWGDATSDAETWVFRHDGASGNADFALNGSHQSQQSLAQNTTCTGRTGVGARYTSFPAEGRCWGVIAYSERKSDAVVANINAYLTALRTGGALPSWRPTDEANLVLWVEFPEKYAGPSVSAWANQGALGGSFSNATAAEQPAWIPEGLNGHPVVHFDGDDDELAYDGTAADFAHLHDGTGGTAFAVHRRDDAGGFVLDSLRTLATRIGFGWSVDGTLDRLRLYVGNATGTYLVNEPTPSYAFDPFTLTADVLRLKTGETNEYSVRWNFGADHEFGDFTGTPSSSPPYGYLTIGSIAGGGSWFKGMIPEIAVYSAYLSDANASALENYASDRYSA